MMEIDRRRFLSGASVLGAGLGANLAANLGAGLVLPAKVLGVDLAQETLFAAACKDKQGRFAAVLADQAFDLFTTEQGEEAQ